MTISVVIPGYNGAQFIQEALESVLAQTRLPQEIIVVDDASTDGTPDLVESFAKGAPLSVRLIRLNKNSGGPARPMNVGVDAASADYIALLDQDDVMLPSKVAVSADLLSRYEGAALAFGQRHSWVSGCIIERPESYAQLPAGPCCLSSADALRVLGSGSDGYCYGGAGGTTIRKSAWSAISGFDESFRIVWDYDFAIRMTAAGWDVAYAASPVCLHRQHAGNLESRDAGLLSATEHFRLFRKTYRLPGLSPQTRSAALSAMADASHELAYGYRKAGRYAAALGQYLLPLYYGRRIRNSCQGLLKTPAQMFVDLYRWPRGGRRMPHA